MQFLVVILGIYVNGSRDIVFVYLQLYNKMLHFFIPKRYEHPIQNRMVISQLKAFRPKLLLDVNY